MITILMRKEEFLYFYPFKHYRNRDVDWEITFWNANSLFKRFCKLYVIPDYVLPLGIESSTWNSITKSKTSSIELKEVQEVQEVQEILV